MQEIEKFESKGINVFVVPVFDLHLIARIVTRKIAKYLSNDIAPTLVKHAD